MAEIGGKQFLDAPTLIEQSAPRSRGGWFWYAAGFFLLVVMLSTYVTERLPGGQGFVEVISGMSMLGLALFMGGLAWYTARAVQREHLQLDGVEELMLLRRWPQAAAQVDGMLSHPMRTPHARVQGLIYLAGILARFHRFGDAIIVYEHLLTAGNLDGEGTHAMRVGRAIALLREDRLFDADRAIAELRRYPRAAESAGLALLEIYRDVKTGHPNEAIDLFGQKHLLLRRQLGHRVADAHALVASAFDMIGDNSRARAEYLNATLLAPQRELLRRYPEIANLAQKYDSSAAPAEVPA